MTCCGLAGVSETVKTRFVEPLSPSSTLGESSESTGASSFVIVPVPVAVPMAAFTARLSVTRTVSLASAAVSPRTETVMSPEVAPAAKVRVPASSAV